MVRPAEVRFYFDADLLGLAKVLARTQLELFMTQWRAIEGLTHQRGPFIYTATRTAPLRAIDLA